MVPIRTFWLFLLAQLVSTLVALADRRTYIIHMDDSKVTELKSSNNQSLKWSEVVLDSITELSAQDDDDQEVLAPELLYTYETAMTGFAARLTNHQYQSLKKIDGFLFAVPDGIRRIQTTHSPRFLGLESGKGLWNGSCLGSDVIIGVVDTGIWPEHESFHDSGLSDVPSRWKGTCEKGNKFSASNCNKKLIGGRAFFKGYEASYGSVNGRADFHSARDNDGHGTHTASTAAGNVVRGANLFGMAQGIASGISYTSRIAAYKVCWEEGCANSDIAAAIDIAISDGVDVLSLSLVADALPYYKDTVLVAALGASTRGVFVSFAAGNDGPTPSTVGNTAPWVMTVGASHLDRSFLSEVKLSNGKTFKGASLYTGERIKQLPLAYKETAGGKNAEFCTNGSLSSRLVKGKIVVCQVGVNYRTQKGSVVKSAGGAAMLLLNTPAGGQELLVDPHVLPATFLGAPAVETIKKYLTVNRSLTASISFLGTQYGARAPVVAAISSRGPNPVDPYLIKPDITAPGIDILAAWPPIVSIAELGSDKRRAQFNVISGTSMSCPHVSGVAALIKSVHRDWSPAAIKSAIMTSALTHDNQGHLISDASASNTNKLATPFSFGSGHVSPERASDPGLIYDISGADYLHYLCSINYTDAQVTVLARRKYRCPSPNSLQPGALNYPSFAVIFRVGKPGKPATLTHERTVTNVGNAKIMYEVFVEEPKGVEVVVEPKALYFKGLGQKLTYNVSFVETGSGVTKRGASAFGSLTWIAGKYSVRSPIAVTWH